VLARFTANDRPQAFPVRVLNYALDPLYELPEGSVKEARWTLDTEAPIPGLYSFTIKKSVADQYLTPNTYLQPEVWMHMGSEVPAGANDGKPFAKFRQGPFRISLDDLDIGGRGSHYLKVDAHDLLEMLAGHQIKTPLTFNPGDVITDQIKAVLALSVFKNRYHVPNLPTLKIAQETVYQPKTDLLTVLDGLCGAGELIRYVDESAILIVRPWQDPANAPVCISYKDDGSETMLPKARVSRAMFNLPNELTLISKELPDGAGQWTWTETNRNATSPISTVNMRDFDGQSLIRSAVEDGVEAASFDVFKQKVKRRLLEISTIPETFLMYMRIKPYHQYPDVLRVTRQDKGDDETRYKLIRASFDYRADAEMEFVLRRSLKLGG
jgi:hypothetical protein